MASSKRIGITVVKLSTGAPENAASGPTLLWWDPATGNTHTAPDLDSHGSGRYSFDPTLGVDESRCWFVQVDTSHAALPSAGQVAYEDQIQPSTLGSGSEAVELTVTAFGFAVNDFAFGSGAVPANQLSANSAPYTFAGTENLSIAVAGASPFTTDTFQVTDTTAALVAARLNGSSNFSSAGLFAYVVGTKVKIVLLPPTRRTGFIINSTSGNTVLGFPMTATYPSLMAFDDNLALMQAFQKDMATVLTSMFNRSDLGTTSGSVSIDFNNGGTQTVTINGTTSFTATGIGGPFGFGYDVKVLITASGGTRTVSFDTDWKWIGSKPSSIASGVTGCLRLFNKGTSNTDIVAEYNVLGTG